MLSMWLRKRCRETSLTLLFCLLLIAGNTRKLRTVLLSMGLTQASVVYSDVSVKGAIPLPAQSEKKTLTRFTKLLRPMVIVYEVIQWSRSLASPMFKARLFNTNTCYAYRNTTLLSCRDSESLVIQGVIVNFQSISEKVLQGKGPRHIGFYPLFLYVWVSGSDGKDLHRLRSSVQQINSNLESIRVMTKPRGL